MSPTGMFLFVATNPLEDFNRAKRMLQVMMISRRKGIAVPFFVVDCVRVLFLLLHSTMVCCILEWDDAIVAFAAHGSVCTVVDFQFCDVFGDDDVLVGLDSWYTYV